MTRRVAVIGGGITGLACVHRLLREGGVEPVLLEGSERLGGKIRSEADGPFLFECGPDSFLTAKPWALELMRDIGLSDALVPTNTVSKNLYLYTRGRLRRYPEGLLLMAPAKVIPFLLSDLVPWPAKLRMGLDYVLPRGRDDEDESLGAFARRRFGDEALETVVGPIMSGIFSGDPDRLSLAATFPQFKEMERKHRSMMLGMKAAMRGRPPAAPGITMFMTLRGGMYRFVETLERRVPAELVRRGTQVLGVSRSPDGDWRVAVAGSEPVRADAVVLAVPADKDAALLREADPGLADELAGIRFASTATVNLVFPDAGFPRGYEGFGFLVDRREGRSLTGVTFTSNKYPGLTPPGHTVIRCYMGGFGRDSVVGKPDEELLGIVLGDLRSIMGITAAPERVKLFRWPDSNPQYEVGHLARLARMEARLKAQSGLLLAGSSFRGIGIPECVRSGTEAARRVLEAGTRVPSGALV